MTSARPLNPSDEQDRTTMTPEEKHIAFFANKKGELSVGSMHDELLRVGESEEKASSIAGTVDKVALVTRARCPFASFFKAKDAVGRMNHARDTGIWKVDGTINEEVWNELASYAEDYNGKKFITESKFYEFLHKRQQNDGRWDWFWLGKKASDGEWQSFFDHCTDNWVGTGEKAERAPFLSTYRDFFEDSKKVFDKVEAHILPMPRPGK